MKIVIQHSETKREIDGVFALCGSRTDLELLRDQLNERLHDERWSYGWVTIHAERLKGQSNTPPVPWDA